MENGRVVGDLYELDYRDHIRQLDKHALPRHTVTATYEDGTTLTLPYAEHDAQRERIYYRHGQITDYKSHPEDTELLRDTLNRVREQREKESRPAVFKVSVRNPKPSIRQQLAAGKKQLEQQRAAKPTRAAAKTNNHGLGD